MSDAASAAADQTLVGIAFGDAFRAQEFLTAATRLNANGQLRLRDAVFVAKDESGKTVVRETIDPQPGRTALSGALWAGLFGLILGGPVGWLVGAGVGAGTGAVTAKVIDHGVPDEWVAWFREAVQPGTTTLALLVEDLDRNALVAELERFAGAKLVYANLDATWVERIRVALHEPSAEPVRTPPTPSPSPPPVDAGRSSDLPPPAAPA
jgi:uncharacterized membrane protein